MTNVNTVLKVALIAGALVAAVSMRPTFAVGPLIEGFMVTQIGNMYKMSVPDGTSSGGIIHDLDAGDWVRFRVKVVHADSSQAYFLSDGFSPTNDDIQLCTSSGCEANRIDLGSENLDWTDGDDIDFYLEAKECALCSWTSFELSQD